MIIGSFRCFVEAPPARQKEHDDVNCPTCGETLPASARFCFTCGRPAAVNRANSEPRYETCEVDIYFINRFGLGFRRNCLVEFIAVATGPNGRSRVRGSRPTQSTVLESGRRDYQPGQAVIIAPDQTEVDRVRKVFTELVQTLSLEKWELQGQIGPMWYRQGFRRRVE